MSINYEQAKCDKASAVSLDKILEEAKKENPEYAYVVAFTRLSWLFQNTVLDFRSVMRTLQETHTELEVLRLAAEKVLDESEIRLSDNETVCEYFYGGADVVRDLRKKGWNDDAIRGHKISELEIEKCRYLTAADHCLNCKDEYVFVEADKNFCSYCEDELTEVICLQQSVELTQITGDTE